MKIHNNTRYTPEEIKTFPSDMKNDDDNNDDQPTIPDDYADVVALMVETNSGTIIDAGRSPRVASAIKKRFRSRISDPMKIRR